MMNAQSERLAVRGGPPPRSGFGEDLEQLRKTPGVINSFITFGTVDGPGIRFVLFLQGCPLRCLYCHNPDSVKMGWGERWTAGQAVSTILRYRTFIKSGGVTFSGGEPLAQPEFVYAVIRLLKDAGIHTAIDTSGCINPQAVTKAIDAADMLLLDIKAFDPEVSVKLTGGDNKNAFATLDHCEATGKRVWIRHVLLRGYTLDAEQLEGLAKKLKGYSCVEVIELLPFHKYGEDKWKSVGREYALADVAPTTQEEVDWAKSFFAAEGLHVR